MGNYQIGKDIQSLDERLRALEDKHDCGCTSRALREDELSETQKKNLDLLRQNSQAIVSGMNEVLRAHGWSRGSKNLTPLQEALAEALNRMMGPVRRQANYTTHDPDMPLGFELFAEAVHKGA